MRWYEDDRGNTSALRIAMLLSVGGGILLAAAGAVGMFYDKLAAGVTMTAGAGMIASALGAKAWQKRSENDGPG